MPKTTYYHVDTVKTREQVSFRQISEVLGIPMEDLEYLNPMYKHRIIPNSEQGNTLVLPVDKIGAFISNEKIIYAYKPEQEKLKEEAAFLARRVVYKDVLKVHCVKKWENIYSIARKYDCTAAQLRQWNHLKSNKLPVGKRIKVHVKVASYEDIPMAHNEDKNVGEAELGIIELKNDTISTVDSLAISKEISKKANAGAALKSKSKKSVKVVYYTVQKGDTLWRIAQKYEGVSVDDLRQWNKIKGNNVLKAGSKIKVNLRTWFKRYLFKAHFFLI